MRIAKRRGAIADEALSSGRRIFAEKPKTFARALGKLWRDWKRS
jgi:hypothetical protein